jgi:hypothetical protein
VQAVLEDGEEGSSRKVSIVNYAQFPGSKKQMTKPVQKPQEEGKEDEPPKLRKANSQVAESAQEDAELRA